MRTLTVQDILEMVTTEDQGRVDGGPFWLRTEAGDNFHSGKWGQWLRTDSGISIRLDAYGIVLKGLPDPCTPPEAFVVLDPKDSIDLRSLARAIHLTETVRIWAWDELTPEAQAALSERARIVLALLGPGTPETAEILATEDKLQGRTS